MKTPDTPDKILDLIIRRAQGLKGRDGDVLDRGLRNIMYETNRALLMNRGQRQNSRDRRDS